jgi:hypothetical protein
MEKAAPQINSDTFSSSISRQTGLDLFKIDPGSLFQQRHNAITPRVFTKKSFCA